MEYVIVNFRHSTNVDSRLKIISRMIFLTRAFHSSLPLFFRHSFIRVFFLPFLQSLLLVTCVPCAKKYMHFYTYLNLHALISLFPEEWNVQFEPYTSKTLFTLFFSLLTLPGKKIRRKCALSLVHAKGESAAMKTSSSGKKTFAQCRITGNVVNLLEIDWG